jgi:SNF2 family DNA or RNA helicase
MIIDLENNQIIVEDQSGSLRSVDKSQLSFWGLSTDFYSQKYFIQYDDQLFLKITRYFQKEKLAFEYSNKAQQKFDDLQKSGIDFDALKQSAANFKNGNFDRIAFDDFVNFATENIKRPLKTHQIKAAYHLYLSGNGANFSVPGSGKTSVVLTVYEKLKKEGKVNTLFVVGPPACFGPWKYEFIETLGRNPNPIILAGGSKHKRVSHYNNVFKSETELYLTTFHSLLSDQREAKLFLKQKNIDAFMVVDEAHYIKQLNGNWAGAILNLSEKAAYRCVLTGTPMPKSYTDIFNLFDFLYPNHSPISSENKARIKVYEQKKNNDAAKTILENSIGPLFYRVRKSDLNLSDQNFIPPILIEMNKNERLIYQAIYKRIKDFAQKEYYKNIDFINKVGRGRMMRLRQSVSYTKLLSTAIDNYDENLFEDIIDLRKIIRHYDSLEIPAKLQYLIKMVKQFQRGKKKEKIVIWSNFIETLKLIEKHLKNEGIYCKKIIGDTPIEGSTIKKEETREKIIDEFIDLASGLNILIANPAACAESISLHKTCNTAIYYDLSYNCAQYLQSLDRIHRVGGSETTEANYYFLQYKNTIDKDIKNNIDQKTKKMFEIIDQDYEIYSLDMFETEGDEEAYKRIFMTKK